MPVKGKPLGRTTYKDISKVYLKDGRTVDAIYAPVNGHYELVYDTANTSTIKGTLPLTFTDDHANGTNLTDYRIYGQTVDGESVGDRTGNLFDAEIEQGTFLSADGTELDNKYRVRSTFGNLINPGTYTISCSGEAKGVVIYIYDKNKQYLKDQSKTEWREIPRTFSIEQSAFVRFAFADTSSGETGDTHEITPNDIENIMLNEGYASYGYKVPVTISNSTDTLTTTIYLPEQIRKVGDEAEYVDYATQKQHRVRKNLLLNTAASQTIDGVTFTVNSDGSVTCNGTANNVVLYEIYSFPRFSGECILSGCPMGGSQNTYRLQYTNQRDLSYKDYGTGVNIYQFDEIQYPTSKINIRIESGYTCNNLTFYPMIRKADIEDDTYEPYIENTEVDVTLPALPTLPGTNVLSVGTEVQPSKIDITGHIKTISGGS